jgi:hypothetical protein
MSIIFKAWDINGNVYSWGDASYGKLGFIIYLILNN